MALLVGLHPQHLHADLLPLLHHVLRVGDAGMAQLRDVDQPFEPAQVDEGAEVAHRADGAVEDGADFQLLAQFLRCLRALLLEERAARKDGVAAAELHHAELHLLADVPGEIFLEAHVHLRGRTEGAEAAEVDLQSALVLRRDRAFDRNPALQRLLQRLAPGALRHAAGEDHRAVAEREHVRVDGLAGVHHQRAFVVPELAEVDDRLALPPQIEVGDLGADVRHLGGDLLSEAQPLPLLARLLALAEEGREIGRFIGRRLREDGFRRGALGLALRRLSRGLRRRGLAARRWRRRLVLGGLPERRLADHDRHLPFVLALRTRGPGRRGPGTAVLGV